jgi:hypothetical protein
VLSVRLGGVLHLPFLVPPNFRLPAGVTASYPYNVVIIFCVLERSPGSALSAEDRRFLGFKFHDKCRDD